MSSNLGSELRSLGSVTEFGGFRGVSGFRVGAGAGSEVDALA